MVEAREPRTPYLDQMDPCTGWIWIRSRLFFERASFKASIAAPSFFSCSRQSRMRSEALDTMLQSVDYAHLVRNLQHLANQNLSHCKVSLNPCFESRGALALLVMVGVHVVLCWPTFLNRSLTDFPHHSLEFFP